MNEKVLYFKYIDSCESCPGAMREHPKGLYRCSEDVNIEFQQNRDMGVPAACPFRKRTMP